MAYLLAAAVVSFVKEAVTAADHQIEIQYLKQSGAVFVAAGGSGGNMWGGMWDRRGGMSTRRGTRKREQGTPGIKNMARRGCWLDWD